ncbi:ABC transporter permease [Portibacter lacus]|uniref:ABC transporter permease n=1 Tax=Portibacter lacus TaxID=1099794 RepID=A0AA37SRC9_9BACT|nr:ABC transporter permease subunit [Portibacter lacus]GLR16923.1 ABC transporter permease [Portibacter lacus]
MKNRGYIGILFFILIGITPFALSFGYALLYSFGVIGVANSGFTLEFWKAVFESGEFVKSLFYSIAIALVSTVISVSLALWFTLAFEKKLRGRILSFVIYLPLAIPGIVASFFTVQVLSKAGFFSRLFNKIGITSGISDFPDLINDPYAIGITLVFISVVMPFFLLLFLNVYQNERVAELAELSRSLGASERQTIWRVSLPVLIKKTWTLIALYFIFLLGAYEIPLILGEESPQMLSVLIVRELKQFDLSKISEGYVVAVIYTVIVSIATILLFSNRKSQDIHE